MIPLEAWMGAPVSTAVTAPVMGSITPPIDEREGGVFVTSIPDCAATHASQPCHRWRFYIYSQGMDQSN